MGFDRGSPQSYTGARARARDPYFARLAPGGRGPTPCAPQGGAAKVRCYFLMLFFSLTPGTRCCSTPGTRKFVVEVLAVFATRANLYLEAPHLESHYLSAQDVLVPSRRHNENGKPRKFVEFAGIALKSGNSLKLRVSSVLLWRRERTRTSWDVLSGKIVNLDTPSV